MSEIDTKSTVPPALAKKALVLIGFQNDYFAEDGILHGVIEESSRVTGVLGNTLKLLREYGEQFNVVVHTPIHFTPDYGELVEPVGILKTIAEVGAFKAGTPGAKVIPQLAEFDYFVQTVPGKRGLNAFSHTNLDGLLRAAGVDEVVLAGTVTSICIDSSARAAVDSGFKVTVLSDCTSSRTPFEQEFYCNEVFPLYAKVCTAAELTAGI